MITIFNFANFNNEKFYNEKICKICKKKKILNKNREKKINKNTRKETNKVQEKINEKKL